jgi:malonyl-CoA/methylmalonyl-CoA synthetase
MTEIGMALSNPLVGERRAGTVGQPLPGVEARLMGDDGVIAGDDVAGQIEVRGPQVFREYWRRPEETRTAFNDTWFRTGDEAVVENGYFRILGRRSTDILKSGGYKLSALEIEDALREHPAIRDCAVVGIPDHDLGETVCAAIVLDEVTEETGGQFDVERLISWATTRLASYKVPRQVIFMEDLPRNAMGKVTKPTIRDLFTG